MFPAATPTRALDLASLARLNIAGGNIRNIALNAAFLAADAGGRIDQSVLMTSAHAEFAKLERNISSTQGGM